MVPLFLSRPAAAVAVAAAVVALALLMPLFSAAGDALPAVEPAPAAGCQELILNPGFESDEAWVIADTYYWAGYSTAQAHTGLRSMRTGIPPGGMDRLAYSSFRQAVHIPPGVITATLRLWLYPLTEEPPPYWTGAAGSMPPRGHVPGSQPLAADRQYVLLLDEDNRILETLLWQKSNAGRWLSVEYDLSAYAGQAIKPHIGTYNDGRDGVTTMYVDDVSLQACVPPPSPTATATPTPTATLPLSVTATPIATPTPSHPLWLPLALAGRPVPLPTATPGFPPEALVIDGHQAGRLIGHRDSSTLYAVAGNRLYRSDDDGRSWRLASTLLLGDDFLMSPADPDRLWRGEGYPCYAGGDDRPLYRSSDGGQTWDVLPGGRNLRPLRLHPTDPLRLLARGCDGPYLSQDGGESWTLLADPSPQNLWGTYLAQAAIGREPDWQTLTVAGVGEGGGGAVIQSRDGGLSWARVTPPDPQPEIWWITDLAQGWYNPDVIHFLDPHAAWWSTDGGQAWQWSRSGLEDVVYDPEGPPGQAYGLFDQALSPLAGGQRYLGTVRGLYLMADDGLTWAKVEGHAWDHRPVQGLLLTAGRPRRLWLNTEAGVFGLDL